MNLPHSSGDSWLRGGCSMISAMVVLGWAGGLGAAEIPRDLPLLMTESGRNFEDVHILKLDPEGPVFRHRHGLAKIPYGQIKAKTRSLLGYPQKPKPKPETTAKNAGVPKAGGKVKEAAPEAVTLVPVRVTTTWWRMNPRPRPLAWPSINPFQATAAIDFLITAGWSPHPIGLGCDGFGEWGAFDPDVFGSVGWGWR